MFQQTHPLAVGRDLESIVTIMDCPIQPVISVLGAYTFGRYHKATYEDKICITNKICPYYNR